MNPRRGTPGFHRVKVALQYEPLLGEPSLERRGAILRQHFKDAIARSGADVELELDTLSVSGQAIEATVPSEDLGAIASQLGADGVRVDVLRTLDFS